MIEFQLQYLFLTSVVYNYMVLLLFLHVTNLVQDANLDFVKTIMLRSFCFLDIFSPNPYNKYGSYVDSLFHYGSRTSSYGWSPSN